MRCFIVSGVRLVVIHKRPQRSKCEALSVSFFYYLNVNQVAERRIKADYSLGHDGVMHQLVVWAYDKNILLL